MFWEAQIKDKYPFKLSIKKGLIKQAFFLIPFQKSNKTGLQTTKDQTLD